MDPAILNISDVRCPPAARCAARHGPKALKGNFTTQTFRPDGKERRNKSGEGKKRGQGWNFGGRRPGSISPRPGEGATVRGTRERNLSRFLRRGKIPFTEATPEETRGAP